MYCSYPQNNIYVGSTNDLQRRLQEHTYGKVQSTKNKRPIVLLYHKSYETIQEARQKEMSLKKSKSRKMIESFMRE